MSKIINPFEEPKDVTPPTHQDGTPKKRFQVKMRKGPGGNIEKAIFIDGELFDWSVDMNSLADAMHMGPEMFEAAKRDIEKHFTESVSEVLGRKVSDDELKQAIRTGWI